MDDSTIIIGHVGRFSTVKNQSFLVDIYDEYLENIPNSLLVMVGTGENLDSIKEKVQKYNLQNNVKFLGLRRNVDEIYNAFDYMVVPSLYEGISLTMIEAQVNGIKIFASDTIDKNTDISNNIKWISLKKTPKEWNNIILQYDRLRNTDCLCLEQYDIKNVAKKMEKIYISAYDNI